MNTIAVTSVALAVAGFCGLFVFYIGLPFALGAVVCGWLGLRHAARHDGSGRRVALVGVSAGGAMAVLSVIGIVFMFAGGSGG